MSVSVAEDPTRLQALSLHASINSVFEDTLYPPGYEASFKRTLDPLAMRLLIHQCGIDYDKITPYRIIDGPVNVRVDYDNAHGSLSLKDIVLPVKRMADTHVTGLLFRRMFNDQYLIAHEMADGSADIQFTTKAIDNEPAHLLLGLAGFGHEKLPTDITDLRLRLAQMADTADEHTIMETTPIPLPGDNWRTLEVVRGRQLAPVEGKIIPARGDVMTANKRDRAHQGPRTPSTNMFTTILEAKTELSDSRTGELKQRQTVLFTGEGGTIDMPVVTIEHNPEATGTERLGDRHKYRISPSVEILNILDEVIFDYLSDAEKSRTLLP